MWRAFVTSVIAAVSLQYIDPFGTAKLVLFQVTSVSDKWRTFELVRVYFSSKDLGGSYTHLQVPWLILAVAGVRRAREFFLEYFFDMA